MIDTPGFFDADGYDHSDSHYKDMLKDLKSLKRHRSNYQKNLYKADQNSNPGKAKNTMEQYNKDIKVTEEMMRQSRENWRASQVEKSIIAACLTGDP